MTNNTPRCFWTGDDPQMIAYHDHEWGDPVHEDRKLFEYLILDAFQAGLSWRTILHKRLNFRRAFDNWDAEKIANYSNADRARLLQDAGIIRNKLKINAAISNARCFLDVQQEFGSFDKYIWQFTNYQTMRNPVGVTRDSMPTSTPESDSMSKDMKKRGFKFVGTTICYAFMQAIGMVDDHVVGCFKFQGTSK
ncbi:DNA-3-methyladenine glycosylase I [candidate division KSB1 bacterium]|nr:DNA-3-methyladenine glycosylase I [candidate division KSB1 bacterium]